MVCQMSIWRVRNCVILTVTAVLAGCAPGTLHLEEKYFLRVGDGDRCNYYRINCRVQTMLCEAEFRQGWFPGETVDALFGDASEAGSAEALTTQEELRRQIDQKLIAAEKAYLDEAGSSQPNPQVLGARRAAILNIRLAARDVPRDPNTVIMEYDPMAALVTPRAGQKLVVLLSGDPDQIMTKLADIAEDTRTEQLFNKYANVVEAREWTARHDRLAATRTRLKTAAGLSTYLEETVGLLEKGGALSREEALARMDAIIGGLEIVE